VIWLKQSLTYSLVRIPFFLICKIQIQNSHISYSNSFATNANKKWVYIMILSHVIIISKIISIALMHIGNLVPFWLSCTCIWVLIFLLPRIFILYCLSCTNSNNSSPFRLRFSPPSVGLKAANDKNASAVPCHKLLTNFITWVGFELTALVVIGTDCIGSY
jgi:hypothetical protein